MKYEIIYHQLVVKEDIVKLGTSDRSLIQKMINKKLTENPEVFGKPLRKSLKNHRKLRVGNFRVIFRIEGQTVKIFAILHRSIIYKTIEQRL